MAGPLQLTDNPSKKETIGIIIIITLIMVSLFAVMILFPSPDKPESWDVLYIDINVPYIYYNTPLMVRLMNLHQLENYSVWMSAAPHWENIHNFTAYGTEYHLMVSFDHDNRIQGKEALGGILLLGNQIYEVQWVRLSTPNG